METSLVCMLSLCMLSFRTLPLRSLIVNNYNSHTQQKAHGILFLRNPSINPMGFLMFYFFMFYFQKSYYNFMYFADIYPTTSLFLSLIRTLYQPFEVFPIMVTFVPLL
jgi:hypothetical protein